MKTFALMLILLMVFSVAFPILYTLRYLPPKSEEKLTETLSDHSVTVSVLCGDTITEMPLDDYLIGVTAAEMPAGFESEALMAQATAARTYTLYKMTVAPSSKHPDADVCTDSSCCKAYIDVDTMKTRWADRFDEYYEKIASSVHATNGECLIYDEKPILAVFHSSSSGMTENSGSVWNQQLPYLVSVMSPETAEEVPKYNETLTISYDDFSDTVKDKYPSAVFPDDKMSWVTSLKLDESGRVESLALGGVTITGSELRALFSLRSSAVSFEFPGDAIKMTTTGYGHGVGMSQYGANSLAKAGKTHEDILKWYYTGIEIGKVSDFL